MAKPIIRAVGAFDAAKDYTFLFDYSGGVVVANEIVIRENSTNTQKYTASVSGMTLEHTIPAGTLNNGQYYNVQIRVTYRNAAGNNVVGDWSDAVSFRCYSTPDLSCDLSHESVNVIDVSSCPILYSYDQAQGDPINEYIVTARASSGEIIWSSGTVYPGSTALPYTFSVEVNGLEDGHEYTIECICHSASGIAASLSIRVSVVYSFSTSYQQLYVRNVPERGSVRIETNIDPIDGIYEGPQESAALSDGWVDLTGGQSVIFSKTELLPADGYLLAVVFKNAKSGEDLITLEADDGTRIILRYMVSTLVDEGEKAYIVLYEEDNYSIMSSRIDVPSADTELYVELIFSDGNYTLTFNTK